MNFLIIDIGNTSTDLVIYNSNKNSFYNRKSLETKRIQTITKFIKVKKDNFKYAICSSVVPKVFNKLRIIFSKKKIKLIDIKNSKLKIPIKLNLKRKEQVGSDRIANSVAAFKYYRHNAIVIDFGTATTFDIIQKNIYQGGLIAPGIHLSLKVLHQTTAQLPLINIKKTTNIIGKDTISAINSGMYLSSVGGLKEIVNLIIKKTKKNYLIIFTGGLSHIFYNSLKFKKKVIDRDITLKGIIEILKFNIKKFDEY
ncbi:MAG: type III pantothenate kinase [Candidatus Fonsibacter sp.]